MAKRNLVRTVSYKLPKGATPITEEERDQLIPGHITTREQLNEWEHTNIQAAENWAFRRKKREILTIQYLRQLHKRMFDKTWEWAGEFRTMERNIGVPPNQIAVGVRNTCDDTEYWISNKSFSLSEIAVRFHHRLVSIHPFPNGNGRHARLSADLLLHEHNLPRLPWGGRSLDHQSNRRSKYIDALRAADDGDFGPLLKWIGIE